VLGKARIVGTRRRVLGRGQEGRGGGRQLDAVQRQQVLHLRARAGDGDGRSRGDERGIVAGDVGDDEGGDTSRGGERGQAATFDGAELIADMVHDADWQTGREEDARHLLFVLEAHAGAGRWQQRRAAAGDERDDEIVWAEAVYLSHDAAG